MCSILLIHVCTPSPHCLSLQSVCALPPIHVCTPFDLFMISLCSCALNDNVCTPFDLFVISLCSSCALNDNVCAPFDLFVISLCSSCALNDNVCTPFDLFVISLCSSCALNGRCDRALRILRAPPQRPTCDVCQGRGALTVTTGLGHPMCAGKGPRG